MRIRVSTFILIVFLIALLGLLIVHSGQYLVLFKDQDQLREWVCNWGAWAPLAIMALQMVQVLLAPIPGQVLGLASGYLFGVAWGTFYSVAGTALGSLVAIILARAYGRPLIERLVPPEILTRLDAGAKRRGLLFFVLVFLLPFLPDDLACLVAGLTPIPIPALMLAVVSGRLPGVLVSCWLGANATSLNTVQWAMLISSSALLAILFLLYENRLQKLTLRLVDRLSN